MIRRAINPIKYLRNHLENNVRSDGRNLMEFRPTIINKNCISHAEGSALVKIGNTTVICGIKAELSEPNNADPNIGFIIPNIELGKLCSPKYRTTSVPVDAQIMSQTLFNIIINSECIDPTDLCICKGKLCWVLYCDLLCLDDDGSILDVSVIALMTALKSVRLPKIEYDIDTKEINVLDKERIPLNLKCLPIASTFMVFEKKFLLADPAADEESISDSLVTISTCGNKFNYIYQAGGNPLESSQFDSIVQQALNREKYIKSLINMI